eukprot:365471-Chlamydomonas_euryale.AAC.28
MRPFACPCAQVAPITVVKAEYKQQVVHTIAVNAVYICYALKTGHVRALNKNTAARTLFKDHSAMVTDMRFFSNSSNLLASIDVNGEVVVRKVWMRHLSYYSCVFCMACAAGGTAVRKTYSRLHLRLQALQGVCVLMHSMLTNVSAPCMQACMHASILLRSHSCVCPCFQIFEDTEGDGDEPPLIQHEVLASHRVDASPCATRHLAWHPELDSLLAVVSGDRVCLIQVWRLRLMYTGGLGLFVQSAACCACCSCGWVWRMYQRCVSRLALPDCCAATPTEPCYLRADVRTPCTCTCSYMCSCVDAPRLQSQGWPYVSFLGPRCMERLWGRCVPPHIRFPLIVPSCLSPDQHADPPHSLLPLT